MIYNRHGKNSADKNIFKPNFVLKKKGVTSGGSRSSYVFSKNIS